MNAGRKTGRVCATMVKVPQGDGTGAVIPHTDGPSIAVNGRQGSRYDDRESAQDRSAATICEGRAESPPATGWRREPVEHSKNLRRFPNMYLGLSMVNSRMSAKQCAREELLCGILSHARTQNEEVPTRATSKAGGFVPSVSDSLDTVIPLPPIPTRLPCKLDDPF